MTRADAADAAGRGTTDRHLVLIGVMGSGKTTTGRELAERWGRAFVDTDTVIESRAGLTVAELFARQGEAAFRDLERQVVGEALRNPRPAVIATGGGAVLDVESRTLMVDRAIVVWLDPPIDRIVDRLDDDGSRPLLDGQPLAERMAEIRARRADLYDAVAHTRVAIDAEVTEVADAVAIAVESLRVA